MEFVYGIVLPPGLPFAHSPALLLPRAAKINKTAFNLFLKQLKIL